MGKFKVNEGVSGPWTRGGEGVYGLKPTPQLNVLM